MAIDSGEDKAGNLHEIDTETGVEQVFDPSGHLIDTVYHYGEPQEDDDEEEDDDDDEIRKAREDEDRDKEPDDKDGEEPDTDAPDEEPPEGDNPLQEEPEVPGSGAGDAAADLGGDAVAGEASGVAVVEGEAAVAAGAGSIEIWGPVALGCLVIVILILVIVALFMVLKPDTAAGNTGAPTVICIDPGHPSEVGSGTSSPTSKTSEISMNWLVAKDLEAALVAKGYQVKLTKDTETETVTNKERVARCVAAGAAFDYRIHMDSPGSSLGGGPWHEVPGPTYTNVHDTSKKYADAIQQSIATKLGLKTSGTQPINGGVRNDTKALVGSIAANASSLPVALIEMMTMDEANVIWLKNPTNRGTLVAAIADGIQSVIPTTSGGSGAAQIVAIAEQELKGGAYEIPYGANCGDGVDKYTTGDCQAWCADFVSWVVNAAGKPFTGGTSGGWRLPAVDQVHAWFQANGIFIPIGTAPQPGDIAIHNTSSQSHVNIVISVSGDTMSVIGGNQSNTVTKRTESWKDASGWGLVGFGRFK